MWLRERELHPRPPGYEPDALLLSYPAKMMEGACSLRKISGHLTLIRPRGVLQARKPTLMTSGSVHRVSYADARRGASPLDTLFRGRYRGGASSRQACSTSLRAKPKCARAVARSPITG